MAKKQKNKKPRQIGKQKIEKKPLIDPKHKSTIWTILVVVVLLIFFIVNNTREVPEEVWEVEGRSRRFREIQ